MRSAASDALAALGRVGLAAARPALDHTRPWTVDAALSTVARAPRDEARTLLDQALRRRDADAAARIVTEHLDDARRDLLAT